MTFSTLTHCYVLLSAASPLRLGLDLRFAFVLANEDDTLLITIEFRRGVTICFDLLHCTSSSQSNFSPAIEVCE